MLFLFEDMEAWRHSETCPRPYTSPKLEEFHFHCKKVNTLGKEFSYRQWRHESLRICDTPEPHRQFPALLVFLRVGNSPPLAKLLGLHVRAKATVSFKSGPASCTKSYQLRSDRVGASSQASCPQTTMFFSLHDATWQNFPACNLSIGNYVSYFFIPLLPGSLHALFCLPSNFC